MRTFFLLFLFVSFTFGQSDTGVLATFNGKNLTSADLSPEGQKLLARESEILSNARSQLLSKMIADELINLEAKARSTTSESILTAERAKVPDPDQAQINKVFDANRPGLGDTLTPEIRKQIVEFLRRDAEDAAIHKYADALSAKYKPAMGKGINAADIKAPDTIFSVGTRSFTYREFEDKYKLVLYDVHADIVDQIKADIENTLYLKAVNEEAKADGVDAGELIAREVTNKLKDFSTEERTTLETSFRDRLFSKYKVDLLLKYPVAPVQSISVADSPSRGPVSAPVTIVMFSDFQCPACSATHPILQKVLAEYGDKIHFVVRNFPLTGLHHNAYRAALAAYAANTQGKFFEYTDLLYQNQSALDDESLSKYAASLGLNVKRFELDLASENAVAAVKRDMADGNSYGISGTPTIFINGVMARHLSAAGFREDINAALGKK